MLVVTKKVMDGHIKIGDDITIVITQAKGQTVRVGIKAPKDKYTIENVREKELLNEHDKSEN